MAHYIIKARFISGRLGTLHEWLDSRYISSLQPFGKALEHSLMKAKYSFDGYVLWEEEDYCSPPLAMEREAVLDHYFSDLSVERVSEGEGWRRIAHFPSIWIFYKGLPMRRGERPLTSKGMPHRQVSQNPSPKIYNQLAELLFSIPDVEEGPSLISVPGARGLWLSSEKANIPRDAYMIEQEFAHLHPPQDGSMHLMAPPNWLEEIISKGWGEKHPLAGIVIPENAVMLYAPRDDEEIDTLYNLVLLSYWRAKGVIIPDPRSIA
ncbi:hypothetical protein CSUB_C1016 [Candidatus Caldarchaeum subterraneum]|uniref:Luciferase domain-containing protein n=1 Tax=Caldiarchaeum subterraneum TaxID=311458 RepID=E6N709_CALS0|nr:hypothetical protein HGMM_F34A01C34 [Candidatus Caldarchaeum subterraneum]BAJ50868.1 hypothetical protein CSUB_C1016 [Candidatus Caldarchaeum subterraneum]